jgi:hypothetical protein
MVTFGGINNMFSMGHQPFPWLALLVLNFFNSFSKSYVPPFKKYKFGQL